MRPSSASFFNRIRILRQSDAKAKKAAGIPGSYGYGEERGKGGTHYTIS